MFAVRVYCCMHSCTHCTEGVQMAAGQCISLGQCSPGQCTPPVTEHSKAPTHAAFRWLLGCLMSPWPSARLLEATVYRVSIYVRVVLVVGCLAAVPPVAALVFGHGSVAQVLSMLRFVQQRNRTGSAAVICNSHDYFTLTWSCHVAVSA